MVSLLVLKMKELVELIVFSEFLRVREKLFQNLFVGQIHSKSRAIKSLIAEFTTILLNELPISLDSLVFMGFSIQLIHYLDTHTTHSTAKMLHNVKTITYNFCIREEPGTIVPYLQKKATDLPLLFCMVAIVLVK